MSLFKKIFLATLIFTGTAWAMAWVFSAMAGNTPLGTVKKLEARLNQGTHVNESETLDLNGVDQITLEASSTDVFVESAGGGLDVGLIKFAGVVQDPGKVLVVKREGHELKVSMNSKPSRNNLTWNFNAEWEDDDDDDDETNHEGLTLSLPSDIAKTLRITSQSGDVTLKNVNVTAMDVQSASGDIEIKNVRAGGLRAQAASGDISVSMPEATGWKFSLSTKSGDIENEFPNDEHANKEMHLQSTSGDIRVHR